MEFDEKTLKQPIGGGIAFTLMIIIYLFVNFLGQIILSVCFGADSVLYKACCSLFSVIAILSVTIYFKKKIKVKTLELARVKKFKWQYVIIAVLLSASMLFGFGFLNISFASFLERLNLNVSGAEIPLNNVGNVVVFSVALAVLPAVFEEVFFRGLLLKCLDGVRPIYAIIAVSLCFSLYHCSLVQFFYQLIYGVLLTMLAISAKSIIPCIITHFLNNFTIILLQYFKVEINLLNAYFIVFGILFVGLIFTFLFFAIKRANKIQDKSQEKISRFYIFSSVGIAVCISLIISALFM